MGRSLTELGISNKEMRMISGQKVPEVFGPVRIRTHAAKIHHALGVGRRNGEMHQPQFSSITDGMQDGKYAIVKKGPLFVATSHFRVTPAEQHEVGGVLKFRGQREAVIATIDESVRLAKKDGADSVQALVAVTNGKANHLFADILGSKKIGERPSDYVTHPTGHERAGKKVEMVIYDISHLGKATR